MKRITFIIIFISNFCSGTFAQESKSICPRITVSVLNELGRKNESVFFVAELSDEANNYKIGYKWASQNMEILEGQESRVLRVLRKTDDVGSVVLQVTGLPKTCADTYTESVPAIDPPHPTLIDEFGKITQANKKLKLENLFKQLQNDPTAIGLIAVSESSNSADELSFFNSYIQLKKIDKTKIAFAVTDETKNQTQLFLIPSGAYNPISEKALIIKCEDFDKLKKLFRSKTKNKK